MRSRLPSSVPLVTAVLTMTSLAASLSKRWISALFKPPAASSERSWSTCGRSRKRIVSWVPPAKSMPRLKWMKKTAKKKTAIRTSEMLIQNLRYFMKSMLVSPSSLMPRSLLLPLDRQLDRQRRHLAARQHQIEDPAADEHRGEQRRHQAEDQGDGETLDRSGAELEQEHGRDQRRHVGVDDRGEGAVEPLVDRRAHGA